MFELIKNVFVKVKASTSNTFQKNEVRGNTANKVSKEVFADNNDISCKLLGNVKPKIKKMKKNKTV